MLVKKEYDFDIREDCWGGAKNKIADMPDEFIDALESYLDDESIWGEDIPTDTQVNDFIWFDDDTYADWLGFDDSGQMWDYFDLLQKGVDEDEIWKDENGELVTFSDIEERFKTAIDEEEIDPDDYADAEEYADDYFERFEIDI